MEHVGDGPRGRLPRAVLSLIAALLTGGAVVAAVVATHRAPAAPASSASPPARVAAAMAGDPARGEVVLFGGQGASGLLDDTWLWNGSSWSEARPAHSPPPLFGAQMAWDPQSRRDILLGGIGGAAPACRSMPPPGSADSFPALACPPLQEAWAWNGTDWTRLGLGPLAGHSLAGAEMATDPASGSIVLLTSAAGPPPTGGGSGGRASANAIPGNFACPLMPASPLPGSTPSTCPPFPCGTQGSAGSSSTSCPVCPPASGTALPNCWPCGGAAVSCPPQATSLTWVFDGSAFRPATGVAAGGDPPLGGHLVWFPAIRRLADLAWTLLPEMGAAGPHPAIACIAGRPCPWTAPPVWEWDGARWTSQPLTQGATGLLAVAAVATDPGTGKVVALDTSGATWISADPAAGWTRATGAQGPGSRSGEALAGDGGAGVVLFGGVASGLPGRGGVADDTWTWDGSRWSHRGGAAPSPSPGGAIPSPAVPPSPGSTGAISRPPSAAAVTPGPVIYHPVA